MGVLKSAAMRLTATLAALLALLAIPAHAAKAPPPSDFAGVPLGTTLRELKNRYPDASRNPDSDRQFQVYQVKALRGVSVPSAAAFSIYQGRVIGGQILLDAKNARYWFETMTARYGPADTCIYCNDPELVRAEWKWPDGTSIKIEEEMLTEMTAEGAHQRDAWMSRADSEDGFDNGDEDSDLAQSGAPKPHKLRRAAAHRGPPQSPARPTPPVSGWRATYQRWNSRIERWLGWEK
jgi:hypothetical protein